MRAPVTVLSPARWPIAPRTRRPSSPSRPRSSSCAIDRNQSAGVSRAAAWSYRGCEAVGVAADDRLGHALDVLDVAANARGAPPVPRFSASPAIAAHPAIGVWLT